MTDIWSQSLLAHTPLGEIVLRLGLAALLGGVLGLERELREKAAGLRTHMLVSLGAATFVLLGFEMIQTLNRMAVEQVTQADPIRVVEALISAMAILSAGTIIQARGSVRGLTTGIGLWLNGAIGIACGAGAYAVAIVALTVGFAVLRLLAIVEVRWLGGDKQDE